MRLVQQHQQYSKMATGRVLLLCIIICDMNMPNRPKLFTLASARTIEWWWIVHFVFSTHNLCVLAQSLRLWQQHWKSTSWRSRFFSKIANVKNERNITAMAKTRFSVWLWVDLTLIRKMEDFYWLSPHAFASHRYTSVVFVTPFRMRYFPFHKHTRTRLWSSSTESQIQF